MVENRNMYVRTLYLVQGTTMNFSWLQRRQIFGALDGTVHDLVDAVLKV